MFVLTIVIGLSWTGVSQVLVNPVRVPSHQTQGLWVLGTSICLMLLLSPYSALVLVMVGLLGVMYGNGSICEDFKHGALNQSTSGL